MNIYTFNTICVSLYAEIVSITPQQPENVGTTPSSNTLNRTPNSGTSICKKHIYMNDTYVLYTIILFA